MPDETTQGEGAVSRPDANGSGPLLSFSQIKSAPLRYEVIDVPEWGGRVRVRELRGTERDGFETELATAPRQNGEITGFPKGWRQRLAQRTMCDESGNPLMANDDATITMLGEVSAAGLARVAKVAMELSGIGGGAADKIVKNSESGHSDTPS